MIVLNTQLFFNSKIQNQAIISNWSALFVYQTVGPLSLMRCIQPISTCWSWTVLWNYLKQTNSYFLTMETGLPVGYGHKDKAWTDRMYLLQENFHLWHFNFVINIEKENCRALGFFKTSNSFSPEQMNVPCLIFHQKQVFTWTLPKYHDTKYINWKAIFGEINLFFLFYPSSSIPMVNLILLRVLGTI